MLRPDRKVSRTCRCPRRWGRSPLLLRDNGAFEGVYGWPLLGENSRIACHFEPRHWGWASRKLNLSSQSRCDTPREDEPQSVSKSLWRLIYIMLHQAPFTSTLEAIRDAIR